MIHHLRSLKCHVSVRFDPCFLTQGNEVQLSRPIPPLSMNRKMKDYTLLRTSSYFTWLFPKNPELLPSSSLYKIGLVRVFDFFVALAWGEHSWHSSKMCGYLDLDFNLLFWAHPSLASLCATHNMKSKRKCLDPHQQSFSAGSSIVDRS